MIYKMFNLLSLGVIGLLYRIFGHVPPSGVKEDESPVRNWMARFSYNTRYFASKAQFYRALRLLFPLEEEREKAEALLLGGRMFVSPLSDRQKEILESYDEKLFNVLTLNPDHSVYLNDNWWGDNRELCPECSWVIDSFDDECTRCMYSGPGVNVNDINSEKDLKKFLDSVDKRREQRLDEKIDAAEDLRVEPKRSFY